MKRETSVSLFYYLHFSTATQFSIMRFLLFTFLISILTANINAQPENISPLRLNEIMKGKDFIGYWPENHYWHMDGKQILFNWNRDNELEPSLYSYSTETKKITKVDFTNPHADVPYDYSQAKYNIQYYTTEGNLWAWDKSKEKCTPIISTSERIFDVQRLADPNKIAFRQGNNLYLYNAEIGTIQQLSFIRKGTKDQAEKHTKDELEQQQEDLFLFIREQKEKREFRERKSRAKNKNSALFLNGKRIDFIKVSKDGQFVFIACGDYPKTAKTHVEQHVTADGYTQTKSARAKVGHPEPTHFFYIQDVESDTIYEMTFDNLPDIRKKPEFFKEYGDFKPNYPENRKIVFHPTISSHSGTTIMDIRSYDNKDRWIIELKPKKNEFQLLERQHDEAWMGGPGISYWNRGTGVLGFWNNDNEIYFQSEETGYSHLYTLNLKSSKKTQLTSGEYEIYGTTLSKDDKSFYLTANKLHPGNREYYKFYPQSKKFENILVEDGAHQVELSPDEKTLTFLFSDKQNPWELFIAKTIKPAEAKQLTNSKSENYTKYNWRSPKVITFLGEDKKKVNARLYQPKEEIKNKAAVIFVHGAGYLQNAHNYWSSYYREFMFHNLLVDNGYTVLDIDFRASQGYGRDHRTAIYRHMGGWDLQDNITGKNLLVDSLGIDPNRVGIYGGSYGGFITLMALLTRPDEFACGAALRSVTDWRHYNHEYTSNILNYPSTDSLAYWRSSPIYFAENLNKPLLILHGMVDDNVQFQDVVRLSQRFIELEKKDWELAAFPVEAHGFVNSYSWTDEYRRIFELFQEELNSDQ